MEAWREEINMKIKTLIEIAKGAGFQFGLVSRSVNWGAARRSSGEASGFYWERMDEMEWTRWAGLFGSEGCFWQPAPKKLGGLAN